jgi:hypothetical protein
MNMVWLLLASCFNAAAAESVDYSLEWSVTAEGTVTQTYVFHYQGDTNISRLKQFSRGYDSELKYVENLLTEVGSGYERVSAEKTGPGRFRFVFRGSRTELKNGLPSLVLWIPAVYDPVADPWSPYQGSDIEYTRRALRVTHRLTIRVPWKAVVQEQPAKKTVSGPGVNGSYEVTSNKDGATLTSSIATEASARVTQPDLRKLWNLHWEWPAVRSQLVYLADPQRLEDSTFGGTRSDFNFYLGGGYGNTRAHSETRHGMAFTLGFGGERIFRKNWVWDFLSFDTRFIYWSNKRGSDDTSFTIDFHQAEVGLSSMFGYRKPIAIKVPSGTQILVFDLSTGIAYSWLHYGDTKRELGVSRYIPSWKNVARATLFRPGLLSTGFGLAVRRSQYLGDERLDTAWDVAFELVLR